MNTLNTLKIEDKINKYAQKFNALAKPLRIKIILILQNEGRICVCDLKERLKTSQSKLSYHLKILLEAELIKKEECGTWSYYELNHQIIEQLLSQKCCNFIYKEISNQLNKRSNHS